GQLVKRLSNYEYSSQVMNTTTSTSRWLRTEALKKYIDETRNGIPSWIISWLGRHMVAAVVFPVQMRPMHVKSSWVKHPPVGVVRKLREGEQLRCRPYHLATRVRC
ncbi:hypothetical protein TNCV_2677371, partial [Trichonephila clavipes]